LFLEQKERCSFLKKRTKKLFLDVGAAPAGLWHYLSSAITKQESAMRIGRRAVLGLLISMGVAEAQQPAPPGMSLTEAASRRFPQPVRVGDLLKREVLQPLESQPTLGRVRDVVRKEDGTIDVVVDYGGLFGLFARPIAVPVDAMVLLGQYMEIVDFTPKQLQQFQTFDEAGTTKLAPDSIIKVGLARPSH